MSQTDALRTGIEFSVVVCTFNRAALLPECIASLAQQDFPGAEYEILLVDNNSADDTPSVVSNLQQGVPNLRYIFEGCQGLSHARNRGWREARGLFVAYVDDECRMPSGWLAAARELAGRTGALCFGGPYLAAFEGRRPDWFKDHYYGTLEQLGRVERTLDAGTYLSGGNFFVSRALLEKYAGFDPEFGMKGGRLGFGEEIDLQDRLRASEPGFDVRYSPELLVHHLVLGDKVSLRLMLARSFANGRGSWRHSSPHGAGWWHHALRFPWRVALLLWLLTTTATGMALSLFVRNRRRYPYFENYVVDECLPRVAQIGSLCAALTGW